MKDYKTNPVDLFSFDFDTDLPVESTYAEIENFFSSLSTIRKLFLFTKALQEIENCDYDIMLSSDTYTTTFEHDHWCIISWKWIDNVAHPVWVDGWIWQRLPEEAKGMALMYAKIACTNIMKQDNRKTYTEL